MRVFVHKNEQGEIDAVYDGYDGDYNGPAAYGKPTPIRRMLTDPDNEDYVKRWSEVPNPWASESVEEIPGTITFTMYFVVTGCHNTRSGSRTTIRDVDTNFTYDLNVTSTYDVLRAIQSDKNPAHFDFMRQAFVCIFTVSKQGQNWNLEVAGDAV
jgi:hypothetical protein